MRTDPPAAQALTGPRPWSPYASANISCECFGKAAGAVAGNGLIV